MSTIVLVLALTVGIVIRTCIVLLVVPLWLTAMLVYWTIRAVSWLWEAAWPQRGLHHG